MGKNLINSANSLRQFWLLFTLILLANCGFQPVYNLDSKFEEDKGYKEELAAIKVKVERKKIAYSKQKRKRIDQQLQSDLEDILNPDNITVDLKYLLTVNLATNEAPSYITSSGTSGRSSVVLRASYILKDINSNETIVSSAVSVSDVANITGNRFAHYTVEEAIELNLAKAAASSLRNALIGNFLSEKDELDIDE